MCYDDEYRSCARCEYALKEFGQVYGCQLEENEREEAYRQYLLWLEEQRIQLTD